MASHFDILAKAKPGPLSRLLAKLRPEEAAIVLTNLPNALAIQVIAFFPDERQDVLGPAMLEARWATPEEVEKTARHVRELLQQAKQNLAAKTASPGASPAAAAPAAPPAPAAARPSAPQPRLSRTNPYQNTSPASAPVPDALREAPAIPNRPGLAARALGKAGEVVKSTLASAKKEKDAKPQPWIPRSATGSPINGPALSGKEPVAGDPFRSPLAKAGLLELIGRAQETLLPGTTPAAARSAPKARGARPEPREGFAPSQSVQVSKKPRIVGPTAGTADNTTASPGARRMDGKAILAAILREAGPDVRGQVKDADPALFRQLRERMFYFDDLIYTEEPALARVFTAAPARESALALKFASPALRDRVMRAVTPGRARALEDAAGGRAGLDAVEAAQKKVLDIALQLQAAGKILIDPRDPDLLGPV